MTQNGTYITSYIKRNVMVGHVARMGQRDSVGKPQGKRTLGRHKRSYKYHRQIYLHFLITFTSQPIHIQISRFPVCVLSLSLRVQEWKIYRIQITHAPEIQ
jgi:hypothetical protein